MGFFFWLQKLCVWCQVPNGQWGSGKIQSTSGDEATVLVSSGNVSLSS